jgi:hypothetical protein
VLACMGVRATPNAIDPFIDIDHAPWHLLFLCPCLRAYCAMQRSSANL